MVDLQANYFLFLYFKDNGGSMICKFIMQILKAEDIKVYGKRKHCNVWHGLGEKTGAKDLRRK